MKRGPCRGGNSLIVFESASRILRYTFIKKENLNHYRRTNELMAQAELTPQFYGSRIQSPRVEAEVVEEWRAIKEQRGLVCLEQTFERYPQTFKRALTHGLITADGVQALLSLFHQYAKFTLPLGVCLLDLHLDNVVWRSNQDVRLIDADPDHLVTRFPQTMIAPGTLGDLLFLYCISNTCIQMSHYPRVQEIGREVQQRLNQTQALQALSFFDQDRSKWSFFELLCFHNFGSETARKYWDHWDSTLAWRLLTEWIQD